MVLKITTLLINKITNYLLWLLFLGNLTYLIYNFPTIPEIYFGDVLRINGFTVLIWTLVTFSVRLVVTEKII
jgi:NAD(P)H-quinone oxidoreductase subunit 5